MTPSAVFDLPSEARPLVSARTSVLFRPQGPTGRYCRPRVRSRFESDAPFRNVAPETTRRTDRRLAAAGVDVRGAAPFRDEFNGRLVDRHKLGFRADEEGTVRC